MLTIWEERGMQKGIQQGITSGERRMLLKLLQQKFGELPASVVEKVEAMQTTEELEALSERILTANSLQEMGLTEA